MATQPFPRAGAATPVVDPPRPAWQPALHPPSRDRHPFPPGSSAGGLGWRRKLAALVAVVALALASGAAGAYAVTSMEGDAAVTSSTTATTSVSSDADSSLAAVAAAANESVVSIKVRSAGQEAEGSGVILSSDGLIVTNYHVVEGTRSGITVAFGDGRTVTASVVGADPATDLAVIQATVSLGCRRPAAVTSELRSGTRCGDREPARPWKGHRRYRQARCNRSLSSDVMARTAQRSAMPSRPTQPSTRNSG